MEYLLCPPSNRTTLRQVARCHPMVLKQWLEPDAGRPARPVLRGRRRSDASLLPDKDSITAAYAIDTDEVELFGKTGTTEADIDRLCRRLQSKARHVRVVYDHTLRCGWSP